MQSATLKSAQDALSRKVFKAQINLEEMTGEGGHELRILRRDKLLAEAKDIGADCAFTEFRMKAAA